MLTLFAFYIKCNSSFLSLWIMITFWYSLNSVYVFNFYNVFLFLRISILFQYPVYFASEDEDIDAVLADVKKNDATGQLATATTGGLDESMNFWVF